MGLFSMFAEEDSAASIPIPKLKEISKADLMLMEKETTGIYLSGHPMDDYRAFLKNTRVVPIAALLDEESSYRDDQIVSIAGIVQSYKMKTTRNNSTMAYVTVEDDTAAIELLAFSNVIREYGNYLGENMPVVITGRLSLREDKEPQIVVNRARPISDFKNESLVPEDIRQEYNTLYLRLPTQEGKLFGKVRAILNMFPGPKQAVVYFADTRQRRGTTCAFDEAMLQELTVVLGPENVVLK